MNCTCFIILSCLSLHGAAFASHKTPSQNTFHKSATKGKFYITQKDIGTTGYSICQPGDWILAEDVIFNPLTHSPAIKICSSNVSLNLNNKSLSQAENGINDIVGILIEDSAENITIKNGTIKNFTKAGIFKEPKCTNTCPDSTCCGSGLTISNIQTLCNGKQNSKNSASKGMGGAVLFDAQDVHITNSSFLENAFSGLSMYNCIKTSIANCHFDDNISGYYGKSFTPTTFGAYCTGCSILSIQDSTFNKNSSELSAYGLYIQGEKIVLENIDAKETSATITDSAVTAITDNGHVSGIALFQSEDISIKNASVYGYLLTTDQTLPGNSTSSGISLENVQNFVVEDSSIGNGDSINSSNSSVHFITSGIHLVTSINGLIKNCNLYDNSNSSPVPNSLLTAAGCNIEKTCQDIQVLDCFATNSHQAAPEAPIGFISQAAGFKITNLSLRIFLTNCLSLNNLDSGNFGAAFGFSTIDEDTVNALPNFNIGMTNCRAEFNRGFDNSQSVGFMIYKTFIHRVTHCKAVDNAIGILVKDVLSQNGQCDNNTISYNYSYGIRDETSNSTNSYYANYAQNNGPTPISTNYSDSGPNAIFPDASCDAICISDNLTPVRLWQLPFAPCAVNTNCGSGDNLDNISVTNSLPVSDKEDDASSGLFGFWRKLAG